MRKIRFNNRKNMMYNMKKKYMNKKPNNILNDKIKMKTLYEGDNGKEVEKNSKYLGIPTLINYVPTDIFKSFLDVLSEVDLDIIKMINEIEYDPDIREDITIDEYRFLLRMNDTNLVYVNIINMDRLNDYKEIFNTIGDLRGTVYLDSYNADNIIFEAFNSDKDSNENGDEGN